MKPTPISAHDRYSAPMSCHTAGSSVPVTTISEPAVIGMRGPIWSMRLPARIASSIGNSAYSDISTPSVTVEAWREIANSDTTTRLAL
ncbi:hypothetical protein D3C72_1789570 [compost metagenome]